MILLAAYGRAYRCLCSIRETARREEADDALILVRALLALTLRALYIVQPEDAGERQKRLSQWIGKSRREQRLMVEELRELGYGLTDADLARAAELEAAQTWAGRLPDDKTLATELGLSQFYSHVYRTASDAAHYGIFTMLEGFETPPESATGEGASISLERPDSQRAADALVLGIVVYGAFLENCDSVVGHGVTQQALELVRSHFQ